MPADARFKPQREINRVKSQIRKLEKDKSRTFPDLGQATYQAFIEGRLKDPALTEICGRLKATDEQIEEGNAEIERLKAQAQQMKAGAARPGAACPHCNAPLAPGIKFCGNCGKGLAAAPSAPSTATACPSCGSPVAGGALFCGECGTPIPKTAPPRAAAPGPPPPPATPPVTTVTGASTPPMPPGAVKPAPPPPPSRPAGPPTSGVAPVPPPPLPGAGATAPSPATPAPGVSQSSAKEEAGGGGVTPRLCPSCSATIDEEGAGFCGECGKKL